MKRRSSIPRTSSAADGALIGRTCSSPPCPTRREGKIELSLDLRHDWGPQDTAARLLGELRWLGITSRPSYVGEPQCNGVMERFVRTLNEECLYLHDFESLEEARAVIGAFIERYDTQWILERHDYQTPAEARASLQQRMAA